MEFLYLILSELLNYKKDILCELVDDVDMFAQRIKDTRNEFVHHNKQKKTFQCQKEELPSAIAIMIIVFEVYLLGIIGFSDEKIHELLEPKIKTQLTGWKHLRSKPK